MYYTIFTIFYASLLIFACSEFSRTGMRSTSSVLVILWSFKGLRTPTNYTYCFMVQKIARYSTESGSLVGYSPNVTNNESSSFIITSKNIKNIIVLHNVFYSISMNNVLLSKFRYVLTAVTTFRPRTVFRLTIIIYEEYHQCVIYFSY